MTIAARLLATVAAPLDPASADAPRVVGGPGRRMLVQRGDAEVVALDLGAPRPGRAAEVRFPAPWPRGFGSVAVSPELDAAVFAGVHAVRSVTAAGSTRWEVRHGCWDAGCTLPHSSFEEYGADEDHRRADGGSVAFGSDGALVWVHLLGPLPGDGEAADERELWLVLDAADGTVLGRADTGTVASGSEHTPHPDPTRMGLSVGEGEDGSPAFWGHWDGRQLTVEQIGTERLVLAASPSGRLAVTVDLGQWTLTLAPVDDGTVLAELDAQSAVPAHPGGRREARVCWDFDAVFVREDAVLAGTSEADARHGAPRHWLVDVPGMTLRGEVTYPVPVSGPPRPAGGGAWYTVAEDGGSVQLWELEIPPPLA